MKKITIILLMLLCPIIEAEAQSGTICDSSKSMTGSFSNRTYEYLTNGTTWYKFTRICLTK